MKKNLMRGLFGKVSVTRRSQWMKHPFISELLQNSWDASPDEIDDDTLRDRVWKNIETKIQPKERRSIGWMTVSGIAASLLICLSVGYWYWGKGADSSAIDPKEYIEFIAHTTQTYQLPDSSKIWMEPNSKIRFAKDFDNDRSVWLTGNSTFEVVKQHGKNFRVHLDDSYIEVKGTCFSIRQDGSHFNEITLFNGRIDFVQTQTNEVIQVNPSQRIVYDTQNHTVKLEEINHCIDWKNGRYIFTDISLEKLISYVNQTYKSNITLHPGLKDTANFTGSIRNDESLDEVLDKICYTIGIKVKSENSRLILYN